MEYHKIQTMWKRDSSGRVVEGQWSLPEFEYLANNEWVFTEKVDGTNIRVYFECGDSCRFAGKTDDSQMSVFLFDKLTEIFNAPEMLARMREKFTYDGKRSCVVLYGEGYGAKIQKGGGNYKATGVDFVLFDVRIGEWWLQHKDVEDIAASLRLNAVPVIGRGTLHDAVTLVRDGFYSTWGQFRAEGLVLRPNVELCRRNGERIITKIKYKDFQSKGKIQC